MKKTLQDIAAERILVLDGAMGTMIQQLKLDEAAFRGARFADWNRDLRGNNDLLILTQPDAIRDIHLAYFLAGADIAATNTFSSTSIAQADYGMKSLARELNVEGARLVREAADEAQRRDGRPRFVAGAIGPTNRTASISPDVSDPGFRATQFRRSARGLSRGGRRADRGRRGHPSRRDDLRYAERESRALRRSKKRSRPPASACPS